MAAPGTARRDCVHTICRGVRGPCLPPGLHLMGVRVPWSRPRLPNIFSRGCLYVLWFLGFVDFYAASNKRSWKRAGSGHGGILSAPRGGVDPGRCWPGLNTSAPLVVKGVGEGVVERLGRPVLKRTHRTQHQEGTTLCKNDPMSISFSSVRQRLSSRRKKLKSALPDSWRRHQ